MAVDALEHLKRIDNVDRYARYIQRVDGQMGLVPAQLISTSTAWGDMSFGLYLIRL